MEEKPGQSTKQTVDRRYQCDSWCSRWPNQRWSWYLYDVILCHKYLMEEIPYARNTTHTLCTTNAPQHLHHRTCWRCPNPFSATSGRLSNADRVFTTEAAVQNRSAISTRFSYGEMIWNLEIKYIFSGNLCNVRAGTTNHTHHNQTSDIWQQCTCIFNAALLTLPRARRNILNLLSGSSSPVSFQDPS